MASIPFSLTERVVIHPILHLRAPLPPTAGRTWTADVWQVLQSEVIARVVAIFTSIFAAIDAVVHLSISLGKGIGLLARAITCQSISNYHLSTAGAHCQRTAWFTALTLVGSIVGVIWPGLFQKGCYTPPAPSDDPTDAPPGIQELVAADSSDPTRLDTTDLNQPPLVEFKEKWQRGSLEEKHWLVQIFSRDDVKGAQQIRQQFASLVYRPIFQIEEARVKWLSKAEIYHSPIIRTTRYLWDNNQIFTQSFFYHATSELALESILKTEKVEVRHEKVFRGAFVSTTPETGFGRCILAFNRVIERLSPLEHGFQVSGNTYWAGFSRGIPVTDSTLAYIMLDSPDRQECLQLQDRCQQWTGRSIRVISLKDAYQLPYIPQLETGIPEEWPQDKEDPLALQILNTLKVAIEPARQQIIELAAERPIEYGQTMTYNQVPMRRQAVAVTAPRGRLVANW